MLRNKGWVNVAVDHDTAEFAVESIRRWWKRMGKKAYPGAIDLLVTADGGGSNGSRTRLWKLELQSFADESGLRVHVSHYPPGTSKWNKVEHRMFCHITQNWRGRPLESLETVVNLIGSTTTTAGLRIRAGLDRNRYDTGLAVSAEEMEALKSEPRAQGTRLTSTSVPYQASERDKVERTIQYLRHGFFRGVRSMANWPPAATALTTASRVRCLHLPSSRRPAASGPP